LRWGRATSRSTPASSSSPVSIARFPTSSAHRTRF
jgi:hypothetical protein